MLHTKHTDYIHNQFVVFVLWFGCVCNGIWHGERYRWRCDRRTVWLLLLICIGEFQTQHQWAHYSNVKLNRRSRTHSVCFMFSIYLFVESVSILSVNNKNQYCSVWSSQINLNDNPSEWKPNIVYQSKTPTWVHFNRFQIVCLWVFTERNVIWLSIEYLN